MEDKKNETLEKTTPNLLSAVSVNNKNHDELRELWFEVQKIESKLNYETVNEPEEIKTINSTLPDAFINTSNQIHELILKISSSLGRISDIIG